MPGSSDTNRIHETNLYPFRALHANLNNLRSHPWALHSEQASLLRRVQNWRKAIGYITTWVQDVRAYSDRNRPKVVYLLEYAFDSVSEVDRVRNRPSAAVVIVPDNIFEYILLDYIRLITTAFSLECQTLYSTPADQEPLFRGRVLYDGLPTFYARLRQIRARQHRFAAARANHSSPQSASPPTYAAQSTSNVQLSAHPRSPSGDLVPPTYSAQRLGTSPPQARTSSAPAGNMVLVETTSVTVSNRLTDTVEP
ncbi:hypothetical protein FS749_001181 [Ceratobasidium sp. UAMH 11750]|nr:hypothetical protein FS749_001181 [Ceratobasidium sp. UAMH 11750]